MLGQNPALRACSGLQREGPGASASYGYGKDFGNAKPRNRLSVDIIAGERNSVLGWRTTHNTLEASV